MRRRAFILALGGDATTREVQTAARAMGLQIQALNVGTVGEIEAAFAGFQSNRPDGLVVSTGAFFTNRRVLLAQLASRYAVPAIYGAGVYPKVGGLMSYGTSLTDAYRQVGVQTGRILSGAKPADLPLEQSTKFELVINLKAALQLNVPDKLIVTADEVIE